MKRNLLILFSLFICCSKGVTAVPMGETHTLTLEEAIMLARVQSVDAAVALNELKTAYWEYRTFRAELLPEVNFTATLPSYQKVILRTSRMTVPIRMYETTTCR